MNRNSKGRSSHMPEKMEPQKGKKRRRGAIKDEEKTHFDEMCHNPKLHCQNQCCSKDGNKSNKSAQSKATASAMSVTLRNREKRSKDGSTCGKKVATITYNEEDSSRTTPARSFTSPSASHASNQKDQTKKAIYSINKAVKTSSENAVPIENSSAKSLKNSDSEEVCFPETNLNAGPSSEDDTIEQNKRDTPKITSLSRKEEPCLSSLKSPKRPLFNCPPEDETFIAGNGKRIRKGDYSQPEDYKEPEESSCLEERGNNQSNREGTESRPEVVLSFEQEVMNEKKFLNDTPDTIDQGSDNQNSTAKIPDQPFEVRTSWEGCAVQKIKNIADRSIEDLDMNNNNGATIKIINFFHYAKIIIFLLEFWYKQEKHNRQDIIFQVGRFTIRLQASDLYCCPVGKDEKDNRNLNYATMKTSKEFNKKYSETLWNYMVGNHDKVKSYVQTPEDATAICAILFSEVIRYPDMFFHNILMMIHYKSWDKFCDYHPMVTGGTWKHQREDVPIKVKKRKHQNLLFCAQKIIRNEGKRDTLFQVTSTV